LRPCAAVVRAARACAWAASRVSLRAIVRWRRPVDLLGDLVDVLRRAVERFAVERFAVERLAVERVVVRLRAVLLRAAGLRVDPVVVLVVVLVFSAIAEISPFCVGPEGFSLVSLFAVTIPANTCL
jgi:hypothetical protein